MTVAIDVAVLLSVVSVVIEAISETIFRILDNVGLGGMKPAWKPVLVMILSVVGCIGLGIDILGSAGMIFVYPWIGPMLTGFLVGGGADIYHLLKNATNPTVIV